MHSKTIGEKINLAIVRIKEEEDFFDYVIFRFVEILNELEFLDKTFYELVKYGTTDHKVITLIKNGFSRGVAELLVNKYISLISFSSTVISSPALFRVKGRRFLLATSC